MRILVANLTKMVNDSGGLAKVTCAFSNEMKRRGHFVSMGGLGTFIILWIRVFHAMISVILKGNRFHIRGI